MKKLFKILFILFSVIVFGQNYQGIVLDEDYAPVQNAQVYYAGTSIVSQTNENGEFNIEILPNQSELIVSHSAFSTTNVNLSNNIDKKNIEVVLLSKIELAPIVAKSINESDRAYYLHIFRSNFLGLSENGKNCTIKNEDDIKFYFDENTKILQALSAEPLIITNKRLGYKIQYELIDYIWNRNDNSVFFSGHPLFIDLNKKSKKKINRRRQKAYKGSLQHFLSSIYKGNFLEQGFEVRKMVKKRNPNYPSDSAIQKAKANLKNMTSLSLDANNPDVELLRKSRTMNKFINYLYKPLLNRTDVANNINGKIILNFKDYLSIEYIHEKETEEYINTLPFNKRDFIHNQTSILWLNEKVEIFSNGLYTPANGIWTIEYMGSEKLGDLLPSNYSLD